MIISAGLCSSPMFGPVPWDLELLPDLQHGALHIKFRTLSCPTTPKSWDLHLRQHSIPPNTPCRLWQGKIWCWIIHTVGFYGHRRGHVETDCMGADVGVHASGDVNSYLEAKLLNSLKSVPPLDRQGPINALGNPASHLTL